MGIFLYTTTVKHLEGQITGYENLNLYYQCWLPEGNPKAVLLVSHGLAEHGGRYKNLVDYFLPLGYAIYALDHRGHGRSEGVRSYVKKFDHYIFDFKLFFNKVRAQHQNARIFIIGHSMGGIIAATYALRHEGEFDGLILSGAVFIPGTTISPPLLPIAHMFSSVLPKMGLKVLEAPAISSDEEVVLAYIKDPLVYQGRIRARLGTELLAAAARLQLHLAKITLPVLALHGTADRLSNPRGSRFFIDHIGSKDKQIILYQDFYHEIFNEPEHKKVFADMKKWLETRL